MKIEMLAKIDGTRVISKQAKVADICLKIIAASQLSSHMDKVCKPLP